MSTRGGAGYATGRNAVAICQRCSKKIPYMELVYDGQYPDMRVCIECWDPKHPQEYLPDTFDPITLYDPTGDPDAAVANLQVLNPANLLYIDPEGEAIDSESSGSGGDDFGSRGSLNTVALPLQIGVGVNSTYYNFITGPQDEGEGAGEAPLPVTLLAKFNGSDEATSYTEESDNAAVATFNGNAQLDTSQKAFGSASLLLDGTGDFVSFPDISEYNLGSGDWTIEGFVRLNSLPSEGSSTDPGFNLISLWGSATEDNLLAVGLHQDAFGYRLRLRFEDAQELGTISSGISTDTWYHFAVTRESGQIRAYFNGSYETGDFGSASEDMGGTSEPFRIGSLQGTDSFLDGWIDNVRFVKGLALYTGTSSYDVPTEDF